MTHSCVCPGLRYRLAADIVNDAIKEVSSRCPGRARRVLPGCSRRLLQICKAAVAGAKVYDLCVLGDRVITEATGKIYKGGKIAKGVRLCAHWLFPRSGSQRRRAGARADWLPHLHQREQCRGLLLPGLGGARARACSACRTRNPSHALLAAQENSISLKPGDMVKIDLGAHIDGYLALGAHTVVLPDAVRTRRSRRAALTQSGGAGGQVGHHGPQG